MGELTGEEIVRRIVGDKRALKEPTYRIVSDPPHLSLRKHPSPSSAHQSAHICRL